MSETTSEGPVWLRRYLNEYLTLEEVGELEGITREGVRQRLKHLGIEPRSNSETRRLKERRETSKKSESITREFLITRSLEETAVRVALPVDWVRRFVREHIPDFEVLAASPRSATKRYSADELFESLRRAASLSSGNLTAVLYDAFVQSHPTLADGRPRPGKQTMALRYGSWRGALEAASLPADPHFGPQKEFDEVHAVGAVVDCWRTAGRPPTVQRYENWQQEHVGSPSATTVRKLTGSWNELLVRAWQVVHGLALDQNDDGVAVPEPLLTDATGGLDSDVFVTYYAANEGTEISLKSELVAEGYAALERAVRSHAQIQNAVSEAAAAMSLTPLSPALAGPAFDIALSHPDGRIYVVEVKSATPENIELQLRIGLGQILRYAHLLRSGSYAVIPVIAVELRPDAAWSDLLAKLGVGLLVATSVRADLERLIDGEGGAVQLGQPASVG